MMNQKTLAELKKALVNGDKSFDFGSASAYSAKQIQPFGIGAGAKPQAKA